MPSPGVDLLLTPYGQSSPWTLLWTFMGYSPAYQIFAGTVEVIAGLLLLSRQTSTLGALVAAGVMANVVMMNLCFEVHVRLSSIHLLLFAAFLVGGDLRRLANVFVMNFPTGPAPQVRLWPGGWIGRTTGVVNLIIVGWVMYASLSPVFQDALEVRSATKHEFAGFYEVEAFTRGGEFIPPLLTDPTRWRAVKIGHSGSFGALGMNYQSLLKHQDKSIKNVTIDSTHGHLHD